VAIEEVIGGLLGPIFRFLGWIFFEVIVEYLIKGLGVLVSRPFKRVHIESGTATIMGILSWIVIVIVVIQAFGFLSNQVDIDSCLDRGGRYNYEETACEFQ
jgi:hypothetical protein